MINSVFTVVFNCFALINNYPTFLNNEPIDVGNSNKKIFSAISKNYMMVPYII